MHIRPIRMFLSENSTLTHPTIACVHHSMWCYGCRMSVLVILCVHPDTPVLTTFVSTCMCKHVSLLRALGLQPRISPLCMSVSGQSGVCLGMLGCVFWCVVRMYVLMCTPCYVTWYTFTHHPDVCICTLSAHVVILGHLGVHMYHPYLPSGYPCFDPLFSHFS